MGSLFARVGAQLRRALSSRPAHLGVGIDLFAEQTLANTYLSYGTETYGGNLKLGVPLREDLSLQLRYSLLLSRRSRCRRSLDNCNNINPDFVNTFPTPIAHYRGSRSRRGCGRVINGTTIELLCLDGQASLPDPRRAGERRIPDVACRLRLDLQHPRQQQAAHQRHAAQLRPGFRRPRRRRGYMRTVVDFRTYYEIVSDLVGMLHLQGGNMIGLSGSERADARRFQDGAESGARIPARGHRSARHDTGYDGRRARRYDVLGRQRSNCNTRSTSCRRTPASAARCSSIPVRYGATRDETSNPATGEINGVVNGTGGLSPSRSTGNCAMQFADTPAVRASVGASLIWDSPFGPLRFDFAYPILKQSYDRTAVVPVRRRNAVLITRVTPSPLSLARAGG